ncbi:MAG: fumarate reductase (quinol) flavoprotein subunit [Alphaproteobacteria bacterium]|jgi:fumarate reductase flavoprotein subunit|nr:fumarate reductase (quinol) flavoprotein subunit [Alphaproteobacteria bacterium]
MEIINTDIAIVGAGGAGLRAAIAVAQADPSLNVALISKVYPMRSHTCAAEGGAAGVAGANDSMEYHFNDTVSGADWLADQDAVEFFIEEAPKELTLIEHWGCPWSRTKDGKVAVRPFGGMKMERTWYAADKSGFHILHTLFQTSLQFPSIRRYDEFFSTDLIVQDGVCQGVTAMEIRTGEMKLFKAKSVIICTGGAGRIYPFTTNGAIKTGDGMAMAYKAGIPLKDMEFVQYHPTGLPGTGILLTEGCRGEGGYMINKDGYRYLQDYGLGPAKPEPVKKAMELGPRDRLSQAFWHEMQKGRVVETRYGEAVLLDMRHLGEKLINERLPFVRDLAKSYMGVDVVDEPCPVRPVVHYMMGGIHTDINTATSIKGVYAVGECACVTINGANRLGSNSLTELLVFGKKAGHEAIGYIQGGTAPRDEADAEKQGEAAEARVKGILNRTDGKESVSVIRRELNDIMEYGCGIYRDANLLTEACNKIAELRDRFKDVQIKDKSAVFNTALTQALELEAMIEVSQSVAQSGLARTESRGAHQRLDYPARDDAKFLCHSMAHYNPNAEPRIDYLDVVITKSQPQERLYGAAGEAMAKKAEQEKQEKQPVAAAE